MISRIFRFFCPRCNLTREFGDPDAALQFQADHELNCGQNRTYWQMTEESIERARPDE